MRNMRRLLTKEQAFTIPNAMSIFRLLLIPFIIWQYCAGNNYLTFALVAVSAVTDMLDGTVARRFNMVSDLGKVLDPICDKLTQAALLFCLATDYGRILILLAVMVVKEIVVTMLGGVVLKKTSSVYGAKWHGKLCTVVFEGTMMALILFPNMPGGAADILIMLCAGVMLLSMILYALFYVSVIGTQRES